jgi:RNA polymerase sigma-70 factor (ECF subfamily)
MVPTDPELVAAILCGQPNGPRALWNRYAAMVRRILGRMFGPDDVVDDLAQEVFLSVFRKLPELRQPQALKAFIISTTILTGRQERRRRRAHERAPIDDRLSCATDIAPGDVEARAALNRFLRVLNRLNARDREAFVLRVIEAKELLDVASTMQVSLATAKRRIARSRARVAFLAERDPFLADYGPTTRLPRLAS